jgi:hypothetical protein
MMMSLGRPCVLLLEGGYNLAATATCTASCIRALLDKPQSSVPSYLAANSRPRPEILGALLQTLRVHTPHWSVLQEHLHALNVLERAANAGPSQALSPFAAAAAGGGAVGTTAEEDLARMLNEQPSSLSLRGALSELEEELRVAQGGQQRDDEDDYDDDSEGERRPLGDNDQAL